MDILWIVAGLGVLGLMVVVHEWGHFIAARFFKIRVTTFSIGFGPRLFGYKRDGTDFCVRAFPLGGYVKMAGENPLEDRDGAPDEFLSKPRWQRSIVALAGPAINIVMAVLLLTVVYQSRFERPAFLDEPARIHAVTPDSAAAQSGLQPGDLIVQIGDRLNPTWEDVELETALTGNLSLQVVVEREGTRIENTLHAELQGRQDIPVVGWVPYMHIALTMVDPEQAAAEAGLQVGDEIISIDGAQASEIGPAGFAEKVQESRGEPVTLTIRRDEETLEVTLRAQQREWNGQTGYFIGVQLGPKVNRVQLGPVAAFQAAVAQNLRFTGLLLELLKRMVTGRTNMGAVQGPIGITVISGQAARQGWESLFTLMALISINLGVLNLLPIPILDGGHIALFALEGILRRDLSLQIKERALQFGLMIMLLLFVTVMYNDIMRYFFR